MANERYSLPTYKGGENWPSVMAPPSVVRITGVADSNSPEAAAVLGLFAGEIGMFLAAQRQNARIGGLPIWQSFRWFGDLKLNYLSQWGYETLTVQPPPGLVPPLVPERLPPLPEIPAPNRDELLDGWLALLTYPPGRDGNGNLVPEYEAGWDLRFALNGVELGVYHINLPADDYTVTILAFGSGALTQHSVSNDDANPFKLQGEPNPGRTRLLQPVTDDQGVGFAAGERFYYDCFRFASPLATEVVGTTTGPIEAFHDPLPAGTVPILKGVHQFSTDPRDTALNLHGPNNLEISNLTDPFVTIFTFGRVMGEFYSRNPKEDRQVSASWHLTDPGGAQSITITDYPLTFHRDYIGPAQRYPFDLSPDAPPVRLQHFLDTPS